MCAIWEEKTSCYHMNKCPIKMVVLEHGSRQQSYTWSHFAPWIALLCSGWKNYHNWSAVKISKWTILGCWNFIAVMSYQHHGISNDWQINCVFNSLFRITIKKHQSSTLLALHWNKNAIILMKFSSLAKLKTVSVTSDNKLIKMTFPFHCLWEKCFYVMMSPWLVYLLELNHTEKHFSWDLKCE